MHINKTLTLKGTKKSEKNPKLQERKSNLLNEKLELIKLSKYTHKKIYTQQQDYLLTHIGEKQWSKTTQHGFSVKGKKNPNMHTHTHTHARTRAHKNQEPSIFLQYTQSTTNTNSELFYSASFLNIKDAHLGCVYIYVCVYIYISVAYC